MISESLLVHLLVSASWRHQHFQDDGLIDANQLLWAPLEHYVPLHSLPPCPTDCPGAERSPNLQYVWVRCPWSRPTFRECMQPHPHCWAHSSLCASTGAKVIKTSRLLVTGILPTHMFSSSKPPWPWPERLLPESTVVAEIFSLFYPAWHAA